MMIIVGGYRKNRFWCFTAAFILLFFSTPIVSKNLFRYVENYSYYLNVNDIPKADAIVVLSGMLHRSPSFDGEITEWEDPDRFIGGINLYKAKKSDQIIFTQGKSIWGNGTQIEGEFPKKVAISMGIPEESIRLTGTVENTQDEAVAVRGVFEKNKPEIILVTSAYHMLRAKSLFEEQGFKVNSFPVDFKVDLKTSLTPMEFLPNAGSLAQSSYAVRELMGRWYYKLNHNFFRRFLNNQI